MSSVWVAFIIVQAVMGSPMPLVNATPDGPASVAVSQDALADPNISLEVKPTPKTPIERITGVEADTYVNTATVSTIRFSAEELCISAATVLRKQSGVYSVSCVQIE